MQFIDLKAQQKDIRKKIALVEQQPFLFSGKIIDVIKVVYISFFINLGFSGAPGSTPSTKFFLFRSTSTGSNEKKTIHHIRTYIIIEPVKFIKFELY